MSLEGFVGDPISITISIGSAIPPDGDYRCELWMDEGDGHGGGVVVLDSFNWDGIGSMGHPPVSVSVTPVRIGTLPVHYKITSAYTGEERTGSLSISVRANGITGSHPYIQNLSSTGLIDGSGDLSGSYHAATVGHNLEFQYSDLFGGSLGLPIYVQVSAPGGGTTYYTDPALVSVPITVLGTYTFKIGANYSIKTDSTGRVFTPPPLIRVRFDITAPSPRAGEVNKVDTVQRQMLSLQTQFNFGTVTRGSVLSHSFATVDVNTLFGSPSLLHNAFSASGAGDVTGASGSGSIGGYALSGIPANGGGAGNLFDDVDLIVAGVNLGPTIQFSIGATGA